MKMLFIATRDMHEMFYHETVHDTEFLNFASRQDRTLNRDINDIGP